MRKIWRLWKVWVVFIKSKLPPDASMFQDTDRWHLNRDISWQKPVTKWHISEKDQKANSEDEEDNTNVFITKPKFHHYCAKTEIEKLRKSSNHTGLVLHRGSYYIKTWRKEYDNGHCGLGQMEIAPLQTSDDWAVYSNEEDCKQTLVIFNISEMVLLVRVMWP